MELLSGHEKIVTKSGISVNRGFTVPGFETIYGISDIHDTP
jgi:hypothetical protein